jgi:hypothetical protein
VALTLELSESLPLTCLEFTVNASGRLPLRLRDEFSELPS